MYMFIFFRVQPWTRLSRLNMMAFCPEHPKIDQNPKFTPPKREDEHPHPFHMRSPPPEDSGSKIVLCRDQENWAERLKLTLVLLSMSIIIYVTDEQGKRDNIMLPLNLRPLSYPLKRDSVLKERRRGVTPCNLF